MFVIKNTYKDAVTDPYVDIKSAVSCGPGETLFVMTEKELEQERSKAFSEGKAQARAQPNLTLPHITAIAVLAARHDEANKWWNDNKHIFGPYAYGLLVTRREQLLGIKIAAFLLAPGFHCNEDACRIHNEACWALERCTGIAQNITLRVCG